MKHPRGTEDVEEKTDPVAPGPGSTPIANGVLRQIGRIGISDFEKNGERLHREILSTTRVVSELEESSFW